MNRTRGRPTTYSTRIAQEICRRLAEGMPLTRVCEEPGMPKYDTVLDWRMRYPEFFRMYARAREDQADTLVDQALSIADQATRGEIDPHAARVAIDTRKWLAAKMRPKAYGDRVGIEHSGALAGPPQPLADRAPAWLRQRIASSG